MVGTDCESQSAPLVGRRLPLSSREKELASLALLTALYCALIWLQIQRHLWFDELLTYHIANAANLSQLLHLVERWDLSPPLSHLLAHASLRLFQRRPIAIRFPSVVEFYFASLFLYAYSARKLGRAFAALPVLLLWYSPMFRFATEGRPYALLCLFFCALLFLWDLAILRTKRTLILFGVAASSIGLLTSHVLAPLSLLPFFAAEVARLLIRRKPDYPLWAALFLPLLITISYIPLFHSYETLSYYPLAFQASPGKAVSFYWHTFSGVFWCLCAAVVSCLIATKGRWSSKFPLLRPSQMVLFAAAASVPVLLDLTMMQDHAPFWGRYCINSAVALYFIAALVVAFAFNRAARAGYAAVGAVFLLLSIHDVALPAYRDSAHPAPANAGALSQVRPDLPLVAASGLTFVEMGQYENKALRSRLFYLRDRDAAIKFAHATIFEDLADFQQAFHLAGTVESYAKFTHDHNDFLVFGTFDYPEDWLLRKLLADGATIVPAGKFVTPYKDSTLFEVHLGLSSPPVHGASNL